MNTGCSLGSSRQAPRHFAGGQKLPCLTKGRRPLTVLVVEDEWLVGEVLRDSIEDHGGDVIGVAEAPGQAFELMVEFRPDVVLMDVRLKDGKDGIRVADAIRLLFGTPIVFCTGDADRQTLDRIRRLGCDLLLKPVQPAELAFTILKACGC